MAAARPPACAQHLSSQAALGDSGGLGQPLPSPKAAPEAQLGSIWGPSLLRHSLTPRAPSAGESPVLGPAPASHLCVTPSQTLVSDGPWPRPRTTLQQGFLLWGGKNRRPPVLSPKPKRPRKEGCSSSLVTRKNTNANNPCMRKIRLRKI